MKENELEKAKIDALIALLSQMSEEVRSRREPEYILTAAFVAASGAVAWGVASLANIRTGSEWFHPAFAGAILISSLAVTIMIKIIREHRTYKGDREEQGRLANILIDQIDKDFSILPNGLKQPIKVRFGHIYSLVIIAVAGLSAALFCLSIYFKSCLF